MTLISTGQVTPIFFIYSQNYSSYVKKYSFSDTPPHSLGCGHPPVGMGAEKTLGIFENINYFGIG